MKHPHFLLLEETGGALITVRHTRTDKYLVHDFCHYYWLVPCVPGEKKWERYRQRHMWLHQKVFH